MAVSHFTDNKFGFSRFTRKKKRFIRSVFLTLVNNYSQRTALFDVLTILPLLVLCAWKGNQVLYLEVEARHHLLLIQNHCHQRSCHRIQRECFNQTIEVINFSRKIKNNMKKKNHSSLWIKHPILVSQIQVIIKIHGSRRSPTSRFTRNRKGITQLTGNKTSNSPSGSRFLRKFIKLPWTRVRKLSESNSSSLLSV